VYDDDENMLFRVKGGAAVSLFVVAPCEEHQQVPEAAQQHYLLALLRQHSPVPLQPSLPRGFNIGAVDLLENTRGFSKGTTCCVVIDGGTFRRLRIDDFAPIRPNTGRDHRGIHIRASSKLGMQSRKDGTSASICSNWTSINTQLKKTEANLRQRFAPNSGVSGLGTEAGM